ALVALLVVAAGSSTADDQKAGGPADLTGTYTIIGGERGGAKIPDDEIRGAVVTFTADRIALTDKDKKQFYAATYSLDWVAKPMRITMTSTAPKAGDRASGVVELSGDTLKICYNLPGGDVPTEFTTKDKQQCFVLKRTKAAGEK